MQIQVTLPKVATQEDQQALDAKLSALGLIEPVQYYYEIKKSFVLGALAATVTIKVIERLTNRLTDKAIDKATDAVWDRITRVAREVAAHTFEGSKVQVTLHLDDGDREVRLETGGEDGVLHLDNARAIIDDTKGSLELFYDEESHQYLTGDQKMARQNAARLG